MGFSVPSIEWGSGVNTNHNDTHLPSSARKNKIENDPKLLKNSKGNCDDELNLLRAGGRHWFIFAREKNKKDHKKLQRKLVDQGPKQCETGRSQAVNIETQKQTKWIEMHQSQVNMCFLKGLLRWLTEQKHPKFLQNLQNAQRYTTNLAISNVFVAVTIIVAWAPSGSLPRIWSKTI